MDKQLWTAVDQYTTDLLLPPDPVLEAALAASEAAGLPAISVSPSQGKMLMILAQAHSHETEDAVVGRLLQIRPQAWPNSRMVGFADERLGRDGRLSAAIVRIYARRLEIEPNLAETMRRLNRAREVELGLGRTT